LRRVGRGRPGRGYLFRQRSAAVAAEILLLFNQRSARGAGAAKPAPALRTEAAVGTITVLARWTADGRLRFHDSFAPVGAAGGLSSAGGRCVNGGDRPCRRSPARLSWTTCRWG